MLYTESEFDKFLKSDFKEEEARNDASSSSSSAFWGDEVDYDSMSPMEQDKHDELRAHEQFIARNLGGNADTTHDSKLNK